MNEWKEDKPKDHSEEDTYCFAWDDENVYI